MKIIFVIILILILNDNLQSQSIGFVVYKNNSFPHTLLKSKTIPYTNQICPKKYGFDLYLNFFENNSTVNPNPGCDLPYIQNGFFNNITNELGIDFHHGFNVKAPISVKFGLKIGSENIVFNGQGLDYNSKNRLDTIQTENKLKSYYTGLELSVLYKVFGMVSLETGCIVTNKFDRSWQLINLNENRISNIYGGNIERYSIFSHIALKYYISLISKDKFLVVGLNWDNNFFSQGNSDLIQSIYTNRWGLNISLLFNWDDYCK